MDTDAALDELAAMHGVLPEYRDLAGRDRTTSRDTKLALLAANGLALDTDAMIGEALAAARAEKRARTLPRDVLLAADRPARIDAPDGARWTLALEGAAGEFGGSASQEAIALDALPAGLHTLHVRIGTDTERVRVIAAPPRAPTLPGDTRLWGVNLALYGLHSDRNPGPGDYRDLAEAADVLASAGADFAGIQPVHALGWASPEVISPYSPSDRGFLNTRHLAVEDIEPATPQTRRMIADWRARAERDGQVLIDYPGFTHDQRPILRALFADFQAHASAVQRAGFTAFRERAGAPLERYVRFEALSERHGTDWRRWPAGLGPDGNGTGDPAAETFHAWLQWQADHQLTAAQARARSRGMGLGIYLDLAVGARHDGAEAWTERGSIAGHVSLGAPPDHLSPAGQDWNLTGFAPGKLAADDYRAFRRVLGQNLARCGVLRIDHVLGLMRSFWIPDNGAPGGYIRQPLETLLALVRIEAQRAGALVVGEDLGLVPDGLREALHASGIYSYSVLQFEKDPRGDFRHPSQLQHQTLACFGTHDTPTLAGYAKGRDIDLWQRLGWTDASAAADARAQRRQDCARLMTLEDEAPPTADDPCDPDTLSQRVHAALARSPAALVSVSLDDLLGEEQAQNLPGTIDEYPNWRRRHRTAVQDLTGDPRFRRLARLMATARPRN